MSTLLDVLKDHTPRRLVDSGSYGCNGKGCNAIWSHQHVAEAIKAAGLFVMKTDLGVEQ